MKSRSSFPIGFSAYIKTLIKKEICCDLQEKSTSLEKRITRLKDIKAIKDLTYRDAGYWNA